MTDTPHHPPDTSILNHRGSDPSPLTPREATNLMRSVADNVEHVIIGHREPLEHLLAAFMARGHVLIEDVPGVGKTMLARSIARSIDCDFSRIQFTPDLLPSDITGVNVFDRRTGDFTFRPGPIFGNVVLGDEINRAPAKTQSALLEAMEERQVTIDGESHALPRPFVVIATRNTVERDRTYDLPLAELDRFTARIGLGYPDRDDEISVLERVVSRHPVEDLSPVTDAERIQRARLTVATVTVQDPIREYATDLAAYTRQRSTVGVSPRGTIALVRTAQARALLEGRDFVTPDDIQTELEPVFGHRLPPSGAPPATVIDEAVESVPIP